MKKLLTLMLAAVLGLSLTACGGGNAQLDAETAIAETPKHVYKDVEENQARAMQNTYLMNCRIGTITDTYFETGNLRVCLPADQLAQLNKGEEIAILGKITDVTEETDPVGNKTTIITLGTAERYDGIVPDVEPREDEIFMGVLSGEYDSANGAWNVKVWGNSSLRPVYFAEGEDISALKNEDAILFTADTIGLISNPDRYINAKIMEVMGLEEMDRYLAGLS